MLQKNQYKLKIFKFSTINSQKVFAILVKILEKDIWQLLFFKNQRLNIAKPDEMFYI